MQLCEEIVRRAHYERRDDGTVIVNVNGVYIRQERSGDVNVNCRPRHLHFSPSRRTVHIRTHYVDMAVQVDRSTFSTFLYPIIPFTGGSKVVRKARR